MTGHIQYLVLLQCHENPIPWECNLVKSILSKVYQIINGVLLKDAHSFWQQWIRMHNSSARELCHIGVSGSARRSLRLQAARDENIEYMESITTTWSSVHSRIPWNRGDGKFKLKGTTEFTKRKSSPFHTRGHYCHNSSPLLCSY